MKTETRPVWPHWLGSEFVYHAASPISAGSVLGDVATDNSANFATAPESKLALCDTTIRSKQQFEELRDRVFIVDVPAGTLLDTRQFDSGD